MEMWTPGSTPLAPGPGLISYTRQGECVTREYCEDLSDLPWSDGAVYYVRIVLVTPGPISELVKSLKKQAYRSAMRRHDRRVDAAAELGVASFRLPD